MYAAAVDGGAALALEFLKKGILLEVCVVFRLQSSHQVGSGIDVDTAVVAVQDGHLAVPAVVDVLDLDQGRKVHGAGQDRCVAVGGAFTCDHAQKERLVEFDSLRGSQILGNQDGGLCALHAAGVVAHQEIKNVGLDVDEVGASGLHVRVVHLSEHLRIVVKCGLDGILCASLLLCDDLFGGILQILVLEHELMCLKDSGTLFACILFGLLIQDTLLVDCLLKGFLKARYFRCRIFHDALVDIIGGSFIDFDLADADTVKDTLTCCNYHNYVSS